MSDHLRQPDDAMLDRLVDGELTAEQRRRLLASLDGESDGWRRCALAFVEAQVLRSDLRGMLSAPRQNAAADATVERTAAAKRSAGVVGRRGAWLAIAAGLALAFFLGGRWEDAQRPAGNLGPIAAAPHQPAEKRVPPAAPQPQRPVRGDAVTLVVRDSNGDPQRLEVPLVEGRHFGDGLAEAPLWSESPDLREQLQQRGLGLAARRRYAPLFFEQHDRLVPMIVPVDDAVVTPVSRPVF